MILRSGPMPALAFRPAKTTTSSISRPTRSKVTASTVSGNLKALETKLGSLPDTLMFVSPTGSVHRIYRRPKGLVIASTDELFGVPGVDLKAEGGMFVCVPTRTSKGFYRWANGRGTLAEQRLPAELSPSWIKALSALKVDTQPADDDGDKELEAEIGKVEAALKAISAAGS